jgi:hypothetical protein
MKDLSEYILALREDLQEKCEPEVSWRYGAGSFAGKTKASGWFLWCSFLVTFLSKQKT